MAYDSTNLSLIGYGNDQKCWLYVTTDAVATVRAANYFLGTGGGSLLSPNDVVFSVCVSGGTKVIEVMAIQTSSATASTSTVTCRC